MGAAWALSPNPLQGKRELKLESRPTSSRAGPGDSDELLPVSDASPRVVASLTGLTRPARIAYARGTHETAGRLAHEGLVLVVAPAEASDRHFYAPIDIAAPSPREKVRAGGALEALKPQSQESKSLSRARALGEHAAPSSNALTGGGKGARYASRGPAPRKPTRGGISSGASSHARSCHDRRGIIPPAS